MAKVTKDVPKFQTDILDLDEGDVGWEEIDARWTILRHIENLRLPDQNEIDAFKVSLKYPNLVSSPLLGQFDVGLLLAPDGESRSRIIEAISVALGQEDGVDPSQVDAAKFNTDVVAETGRRLEQREVTPGLLHYWGWLNFASGLSAALLIMAEGLDPEKASDPAQKRFLKQRNNKTLAADQTPQKYWYAHWMMKRGLSDGSIDRKDEDAGLAILCAKIRRGERQPMVHSREWFSQMIDKEEHLKTTFSRLTPAEIQQMANNTLIPLTAIPPLDEREFPDT